MLQISGSRCLDLGCRSYHAAQAHIALRIQSNIGRLAAKLPIAAQRAGIDLHGLLGDQAAGVIERFADRSGQCVARSRAALLHHVRCSELQVAASRQAARVIQQAGGTQGGITLRRQLRTLRIPQRCGIQAQRAHRNDCTAVVHPATSL
ncbi:hypothetical protein GGR76_001022 [Xanthomonas translucens]|nr:hypothetical protein [Xanthomonas campestris]